jgi:peptide/nickel transport system permease protein
MLIWGVAIVAALFPSLLAHGDPNEQDLLARLLPPRTPGHLLGTDQLGEDVYTRLVYGARTSVVVGLAAVALGATIGTIAGLIGGYFGWARGLIGTLIDIQMAFPGLLLAIAIAVMVGGGSIVTLILILGLTGWAGYARVLRGLTISLRERDFVRASVSSGASHARILITHILPNVAPTLAVVAVLDLSRVILSEATLSFIGYGVQPPTVSWGLMLATGKDYIYTAWWLVTLPGIAVALLVIAVNLIAHSLQAEVDPLRQTVKRI